MYAFVLMPFSSDFDIVYADLIKPAFIEEGYVVGRADELSSHQSILKAIIRGIADADLVIAEVSSLNPNVFYELGIAHGLRKPTILLTRDVQSLPFDLRSYRVIPYSLYYPDFKKVSEQLRDIAKMHKVGKLDISNPVIDYIDSSNKYSMRVSQVENNKLEDDDIEELGILDYTDLALEALHEVGTLTNTITTNIVLLSRRITERTSLINNLLAKNPQADPNAQKTKLLLGVTDDLDQYSSQVQRILPSYQAAWEKLRDNVSGLLAIARINTPQDRESVQEFRNQIRDLHEIVINSTSGIGAMTSSFGTARGYSKNLNKAVRKAERVNLELEEIIATGDAYLVRIIDLCDEAVASYDTQRKLTSNNP